MATRPSEEFKRDAVRIALTSGLTRRQARHKYGVAPERFCALQPGQVWDIPLE